MSELMSNKKQIFLRKIYLYVYELFYGMSWCCIAFNVAMLNESGMKDGAIGLTMALMSAMGAVAPMVWGLIADKFRSRKKIYLLLLSLAAVVHALIPISANLQVFGIALIVITLPMANAFRLPGNSMLDTLLVNEAKHIPGADYSSIRVWASIGYAIGAILATNLMKWLGIGIELAFYIYSGLTVLVILMSRGIRDVVPEEGPEKKRVTIKEMQLKRLLGNYYVLTFIITAVLFSISASVSQYLPKLFELVGGSAEQTGSITGFKTFVEVAVLFACPFLKKKFSLTTLYCVGGVLYCIELFLYQYCTTMMQIQMVQLLNGAGLGLLLGNAINYMSELAPKGLEASAMALYGTVGSVAGIISNLVIGRLLPVLGIRSLFTLFGGLVLLSIAFYLGSFAFGKYVLKKDPPVPLGFVKKQPEAAQDSLEAPVE